WSQVVSLALLGAVFVTAASVKHQTSIDAKNLAHTEYTAMLLGKLEAPPAPTEAEKLLKQEIEDARKLAKVEPKPKPKLKPETEPPPEVISDLPMQPKLAAAIPRRKRGDSHNLRKTRKSGILSAEEAWQAADEFAEVSEESGKLYMPNASDDELWDAVKRSPVKVGGGMILDLQGKGRGGGWHDDDAVDLSPKDILASTSMGSNQSVGRHVGDPRGKFDAPIKKRDRSGAREKLLRKAGPAASVAVKSGGRTPAQVARVANNNGPALRKCQDQARRLHSDLEGTVAVAFTVDAGGSVDDVELVRNTTSARALGGCVARAVRKFHFGPGKAAPRVTYKMQLH
ncbi:MAG: TonB family protein, partial [Nannocystaceae bacterium]